GMWPVPWKHRMFVTLAGVFCSWTGARVITIDLDPSGMPMPGGDYLADGGTETKGSALDFAQGWDDGKLDPGRASDVTFSSDGRLFISQYLATWAYDWNQSGVGIVMWIAPLDLPKQ